MLAALYIENLAVIEKTYVDFPRGFSVFTGETGAGKSILIDAINACLGQRTSREIVRTGAEKASVSAVFKEIPESVTRLLSENGYEADNGELMVSRDVHADGRSAARIGSRPATVGFLREMGAMLVNIHGQHDNQILLSQERHVTILDNYGGLNEEREAYHAKFRELSAAIRKLRSVSRDEEARNRREELLKFQIEEITAARLSPGLEERLQEKSLRFRSVEKLARALEEACGALLGDDENSGAVDLLSEAKERVQSLSDFPEFSQAAEGLEGLSIEAEEWASNLHDQLTNLDYDQQEADRVEEKLSEIQSLKMKYGNTVSEILDYLEDAKRELSELHSSEEEIRRLSSLALSLKKETAALAQALTAHRKEASRKFTARVAEEARFLEMPNLRMEARFTPVKLGIGGDAAVELLISANLGEPPKPIAKIASGGELSRIMLAIKSALADKDDIGTLIFDEIDTGVSGKAAQKIGRKLREVAASRQVLCVTHSAQIAALGEAQFLIRKETSDGRTRTKVLPLDEDGRVEEIARIMSTDAVSDLMRQTARSMLADGAAFQ